MSVTTIIRQALRTDEDTGAAAAAWAVHRRKLAELSATSAPLCRKRDELSVLVDRAEVIRRQLTEAVQVLKSTHADAMNGDATDAAVTTAERTVSTLRSQLTDIAPKAEVAALALERTTVKIGEITRAVEAWQRQAPTLQHAVLRERMAAMAPAHQAALDAYLDSLVELAGIASAADSLVPKGAGLAHSHSGFLMGVVFPAPEHAAYAGQGAPRDITLIARQRAAEILAQLNV